MIDLFFCLLPSLIILLFTVHEACIVVPMISFNHSVHTFNSSAQRPKRCHAVLFKKFCQLLNFLNPH